MDYEFHVQDPSSPDTVCVSLGRSTKGARASQGGGIAVTRT